MRSIVWMLSLGLFAACGVPELRLADGGDAHAVDGVSIDARDVVAMPDVAGDGDDANAGPDVIDSGPALDVAQDVAPTCIPSCPNPPNAVGVCNGSICGMVCNAGFADCDGRSDNGCETDTTSDRQHCGGCAVVCGTDFTLSSNCNAGTCVLNCRSAFGDCDRDPANGCETPLTDDDTNCGMCNRTCSGTTMCCGQACLHVSLCP